MVLIYKIIFIGSITASASTLVMPIWFTLGDIIAEIYGYKIAKHLIWMSVIFQLLFAFTCGGISFISSPPGWSNQEAYKQLLGKLPRVAVSSFMVLLATDLTGKGHITRTLTNGRSAIVMIDMLISSDNIQLRP